MAAPEPAPEQYNYPWATSPDIIRSYQKDAYVTSTLSAQLNSILRQLLGARFAHKYSNATTHLSELLYLCLTTLLGNRTLGEEYCDVIQVEDDTLRLAGLARRAGYIASVVFSPWVLAKALPALRRRLRAKLERNVERGQQRLERQQASSLKPVHAPLSLRLQQYVLTHLDSLTSISPIYALSLAAFYFTSAYYHISKRLFHLRYIFTKKLAPNEQREGYEVLGILLVLQMAVQGTLHLRETFFSTPPDEAAMNVAEKSAAPVSVGGGVEMAMGSSAFYGSDHLLLSDLDLHSTTHKIPSTNLEKNTHTPNVDPNENPHYHLTDSETMAWIPAGQQRKCTLCLEPFKDPSVTTCGHVFCWSCVQDWVREKAECPLCRTAIQGNKILPLRG